MGTNYYHIPTEEEMQERKARLQKRIEEMELTPGNIERRFSTLPHKVHTWDTESPWEEFTDAMVIHLGKRSGGWLFCWNFHNNKYYRDKATLLQFIRSGRVVDEYGEEQEVEEFIKMALEWGQPDGWRFDAFYVAEQRKNEARTGSYWDNPMYYDREIDGLRVSSSTDFC